MRISGRLLTIMVVALAPASGLAAQQSSMQTINSANSAKTEVVASQQSSDTSTNGTGGSQQRTTAGQGSLGDVVRQQRLNNQTSTASTGTGQQKSLGEIAAERRVTRPVRPRSTDAGTTSASYRKGRTKTSNRKKRDPFGQPVTSAAR